MTLDTLRHDLAFALRSLIERPGYALVVMLTLALGIGANTAIFSVVKTVLLDALPFHQPGRLVAIAQANSDADRNPISVGYPTLLDWQRSVPALESVAASADWQPNLTADGSAELVNGQSVTRDFFKVLGVAPALGRMFTADEDQPNRNDVVVISHGLWRPRFNGACRGDRAVDMGAAAPRAAHRSHDRAAQRMTDRGFR